MEPSAWGLDRTGGRLSMESVDLVALAAEHGTPLHVASVARLRARADELKAAFARYGAPVRVHFSYKTSYGRRRAPGVHGQGLGAEVVSASSLWPAPGLPGRADRLQRPAEDR